MINKRMTTIAAELFAGSDAGHYDLPATLVDARARLAVLDAAVAGLSGTTVAADALAAAVAVVVADPGTGDDFAGAVLAARHAEQVHAVHAEVVRTARATVAGSLIGDLQRLAESVLTDHLRPALTETVDHARTQYAVFSPSGRDERELFHAPPKVRSAWSAFVESVHRYDAVLRARSTILEMTGRALKDDRGLFSRVRNAEIIWPELLTSKLPVSTMVPPWPKDGAREFLIWALDVGAELWCPTAAEQDARWLEVYGPRIAEHQRAGKVVGQFRELVVG